MKHLDYIMADYENVNRKLAGDLPVEKRCRLSLHAQRLKAQIEQADNDGQRPQHEVWVDNRFAHAFYTLSAAQQVCAHYERSGRAVSVRSANAVSLG